MILRMKVLILLMSLVTIANGYQEKKVFKIYNKNLIIIKDRLNKKEWQDLGEVNNAIKFFEEITGIISHSNGNYFGRYYPTEEDYTNWLNWFKENRSRLYWDKKEQKVKVRLLQHPSCP